MVVVCLMYFKIAIMEIAATYLILRRVSYLLDRYWLTAAFPSCTVLHSLAAWLSGKNCPPRYMHVGSN